MNATKARIILAAVKEWEDALARVRKETNYGQGFEDEPLTDEKAIEVADALGIAWAGVEVALRLSTPALPEPTREDSGEAARSAVEIEEALRLARRGRHYAPRDSALLARALLALHAERERLRGWPSVKPSRFGVSHSPVDFYRCENEDCPDVAGVWQFRPDDCDLDDSVVLCRTCRIEGVLFFRWFRSDDSTVSLAATEKPGEREQR